MFEGLTFMEGLLLLMFVSLFFKETAMKWLNQKLGMEHEEVPEWASRLIQYTNHDTTKMHEKTHAILERMEDKQANITTTLNEFKEYGIKTR